MALGVSVSIKIVEEGEDTGELGRWLDLLDNPPKELKFIRLEGTSRSGACEICAQYFGMEHDGSGRDVPIIPIHPNCVCIDQVVDYSEATSGGAPAPLKRGEWLQSRPAEEKAQILGQGRAKLLESGAITLKDIYKRGGTPLARGKPLKAIAAGLARQSKAKLAKAAREAGIDPDGLSRDQIVNQLAGRRVRRTEPVDE